MPVTVLGDIVVLHRLYLAAKPSRVGVDVDGLAYHQHRPMVYNHQMRGQGFFSGVIPSHRAAVDGGAFPGCVKPVGLDS
jgi:hypothetical protein